MRATQISRRAPILLCSMLYDKEHNTANYWHSHGHPSAVGPLEVYIIFRLFTLLVYGLQVLYCYGSSLDPVLRFLA